MTINMYLFLIALFSAVYFSMTEQIGYVIIFSVLMIIARINDLEKEILKKHNI